MIDVRTKVSSSALSGCKNLSGLLITVGLVLAVALEGSPNRTKIKNPLIYSRLRHDANYLQLYRNFQPKQPHEERPVKLRPNSYPDKSAVNTYYENSQFDADNITLDDLVLEALDRTYVSSLFVPSHHHYDDPEDRRKASDPRLVSPTRCANELSYLKRKLDQQSTNTSSPISPELAAFFDSYANEEPGLLFGNYHWTGNWRQCAKRLIFDLDRANASNSISFQGRYCIASIRSDRWQAKIEQRARERVETYFKSADQQYDYRRFFRIQVGICLPESCDSTTFERAELADMIRQLAVRKLNEPFKSYKLVDLFCLPDETSELRQLDSSGRLFVLAGLVWCSLIVAATCYDVKRPEAAEDETKGKRGKDAVDKLVSAMSLRRNLIRLTRLGTKSLKPAPLSSESDVANGTKSMEKPSPTQLGPDDLTFIDFFRSFSMPWIMLGHLGLWLAVSEKYPLAFDKGYHSLVNVVLLIDWYFVMAGFITVYYLFTTRRVDRMPWSHWLYSVFHRYWRLAPMYIIIFWFCRSVLQSTGQGPVWDYGTTNMTFRGVCKQESWLWPITLTSNLHSQQEECVMPSWFVSCIMEFYLITPFVMIGLARWPIATWLITIALIAFGVGLRINFYLTNQPQLHLDLLRARFDIQKIIGNLLHEAYLYPQYRITTYLIGFLAGHFTYMVLSGQWVSILYAAPGKNNQADNQKLPAQTTESNGSVCRRWLWYFGASVTIAMIWSTWFMDKLLPTFLEPYASYIAPLLYGISHPSFGLALALLLVTFMFGQFESLRSLLAHPVWTLLSRINFSLLMLHCELIHWMYESADHLSSRNYADIIKEWIWLMSVCYPLAIVGTLLLELPLAILEREFVGSWLMKRTVDRSKLASLESSGQEKVDDGGGIENSLECTKNSKLVYVIGNK